MSHPRKIKVLAIASGGGHWVQLLRLRPAWADCETSYATVHAHSAGDVPGARFFTFVDASRANPTSFALTGLQIARTIAIVRPNVIVTTGSAPALLAILMGRLIGARTIWIDSIANSECLSASGEKARSLAHVCLTQWQELARGDRPDYWGRVL